MSETVNLLAFDLSAESGRAIIGHFDGERLSLEEVHPFLNGPVRLFDSLHWDILRLFSELKQGLAKAVHEQGAGLASLVLDTLGVDFALIDRDGALLGTPYHYRDTRTDGMLEEAFRRVSREQIFAKTGIQSVVLGADVGQFVLLPVAPDVLDRALSS